MNSVVPALGAPRWAFDWLLLLVVATLLVGLAYRVWHDRPTRDVNRWFAFQALTLAAWVTGVAAAHSGLLMNFWMPWTFASAALFPLAFVGFTRRFPERTRPVSSWLWLPISAVSIVLCLICMGSPWIVHSFELTNEGLHRLPGPLYPVYAAFLPTAMGALLAIQIARWREARGRARLQLQYYIVGVSVLAIGGFTTNLAIPTFSGRSTYSIVGPYFSLAFLGLVAHSIIRHRLLDLRLVVSHSLTFAAAILASLMPAGTLLAFLWPRLSDRFSRDELAVGVAAVVTAVAFASPLREFARATFDRYIYRERTNARRILRDSSGALSSVLDLERLAETITLAVDKVIRCDGVALYLSSSDGVRLARSMTQQALELKTPTCLPAVVARAVTAASTVMIVADDIERLADQNDIHAELDGALRDNAWAVVAPLGAQGRLVGVLVIGRKLSGDPFSSEDLDAISTLANHAGSAVKNARLYAESALAKSYIENILTTIPSGVVSVSADGRIGLLNPAGAQLTGLDESEVRHAAIETLSPPLCDALRAAMGSTERCTYPQIAVSLTEPDRMAICTTAPLRDHTGCTVGAVAVFSDLRPLRDLERERSRAERLAEFQVLTQALAHEIANPISPIKTMTRLLEQRGDDRAFILDFQRIVTRELDRIERLIARLRAVGRPQRPPIARADLGKAVMAAVEVLTATADERGISLNCRVTAREVGVTGDQAEFEELFLNLIKNAIEAIPADPKFAPEVCVDVVATDGHAVVRVRDNGSGFPPALIDQIFVPFVTTKLRGTGLGLAICASIVQRAGGHLDVANSPEGGGIVTVRLPLA